MRLQFDVFRKIFAFITRGKHNGEIEIFNTLFLVGKQNHENFHNIGQFATKHTTSLFKLTLFSILGNWRKIVLSLLFLTTSRQPSSNNIALFKIKLAIS